METTYSSHSRKRRCAVSPKDGSYCVGGKQLWDLRQETYNWDPSKCDSPQVSCTPAYDNSAVANNYWSSIYSLWLC